MKEVNTLEQLAEAIQTGDKSKINEASLNRVYQHAMGDGATSFAILTAYRYQNPKQINISLNKKLEGDVRSLGLGFFKMKGYWLECQDPDIEYDKCPEDMLIPSIEISLFIPNISKKDALRLGKTYKQDGFVYQGEDTDNKTVVLAKNGTVIRKFDKFSPNKIAQGYSQVKGRNFTFEGFEYRPSGMMSNLTFEAYLKKYKK
jgi:hypothetical protein